jgi:hypothetical protein
MISTYPTDPWLEVTQPAASSTAGGYLPSQPAITIRTPEGQIGTADLYGNVEVIATIYPTNKYAAKAPAVCGIAVFTDIGITVSGEYRILFNATIMGINIANFSFTVTVLNAAPDHLRITQQPKGAQSGLALNTQPIVIVQDPWNNTPLFRPNPQVKDWT